MQRIGILRNLLGTFPPSVVVCLSVGPAMAWTDGYYVILDRDVKAGEMIPEVGVTFPLRPLNCHRLVESIRLKSAVIPARPERLSKPYGCIQNLSAKPPIS